MMSIFFRRVRVLPEPADSLESTAPLAVEWDAEPAPSSGLHGVSAGMASLFDQALVSATNFFTALVIARLCSKEEMGLYYLAWTIVVFLLAAQGNLISIPYTIYWRRRAGEELAAYAGSMLAHQLLLSLVAVTGVLLLQGIVALGAGPRNFLHVGWVLCGMIPFLLMRDYARRFAFAHLNLRAAIALDALVALLQLGGLAGLALTGMLSVPAVYAVTGLACAASSSCWWLARKRTWRFAPARILRDWRENWDFGRWAFGSQLSGLAFYLLPWLLAAVHGEAATGVFGVCNHLMGLANLFVIGMCNYLSPRAAQAFFREGVAGLTRIMRKIAMLFFLTLGSLCVLIFIARDVLVVWVYSAKYDGTGPIIVVLAVGIMVEALGLTANHGLWAMDRPAANFVADACQLLVTLGVALYAVYPLGVLGIAMAMTAGRTVSATVRWCILRGVMHQVRNCSA